MKHTHYNTMPAENTCARIKIQQWRTTKSLLLEELTRLEREELLKSLTDDEFDFKSTQRPKRQMFTCNFLNVLCFDIDKVNLPNDILPQL